MFEAIIIRHIQTVENREYTIQGTIDGTPNPEEFGKLEKRAQEIRQYALDNWGNVHYLITGDLYRQVFTAESIQKELKANKQDPFYRKSAHLRERCWGAAQGKTCDAIGYNEDVSSLFVDFDIVGCETIAQVKGRADNFVDEYMDHNLKMIIVGSELINNFVINSFLGTMKNFQVYPFPNLGAYHLDKRGAKALFR